MRPRPRAFVWFVLPIVAALSACVSRGRPAVAVAGLPCPAAASHSIEWRFLGPEGERRESAAWCAGVGPPVIREAAATAELPSDWVTVVSWNTHVGAGRLSALVADLRAGRLSGGRPVTRFVLLLQEAVRSGRAVPRTSRAGMRGARPIAHAPGEDIESAASSLGLSLFYVPSMRNGGPSASEDRGNAVLASVPIEGFTAIELPLERQRRIALAVTARIGRDALPLRLATAHLTNVVGHHLWIFSEAGRTRQAEALALALDDGPIVLGGDFNTWFGSADAAYRVLARRFTAVDGPHPRPTFGMLRLDHFFVRLPPGWQFTSRRADSRYGSDHYPLIGEIRVAPGDRPDPPR